MWEWLKVTAIVFVLSACAILYALCITMEDYTKCKVDFLAAELELKYIDSFSPEGYVKELKEKFQARKNSLSSKLEELEQTRSYRLQKRVRDWWRVWSDSYAVAKENNK